MAKKKIIRKSNRALNLFVDGGENITDITGGGSSGSSGGSSAGSGGAKQTWGQQAKAASQEAFSNENLGGTITSLGSAAGSIIGAGLANSQIADTSSIEGQVKQAETYTVQAKNNDDLMNEWASFSPMEHVSWRDIRGGSTGQRIGNTIGASAAGAGTGFLVGGPVGGIIGGAVGLFGGLAGIFGGNSKAKRKAAKFNRRIDKANAKNLVALNDRATSIDTQNDLNMLAKFSAYGGPINIFGSGATDYELAKEDLYNKQLNAMSKYKLSSMPNSFEIPKIDTFADGGRIYIKPENRGKFTSLKKRTGKSATWFKENGTPAQKKMATFALNSRKWKHELGGDLYKDDESLIHQHGGDFSNGVTIIGNGGLHEQNPMEGVLMGIAPDGTPNLVEQGEVKFNNYIFSNRLFATGGLLESYNLPTTYANHSFADIAERLNKESSERPNDPISKNGLVSSMERLKQAQEQIRAEKQNKQFAKGGHLFSGGGPDGMDPLYEEEENYLINPTGSKLPGNPFALDNEETVERQSTKPEEDPVDPSSGLSWLRYAPVVGSGLNALSDIFGWTNRPDYSNANLVGSVADNLTKVSAKPVSNYLTYRPLDRNYYINKLNAQAGATRRAIANQSGGNRATAMAGLLAADYNALNSLGELARKAEEYNQAQRERVEAFNRGTNQFNSEMALKAAIANKENDKLRLQARTTQAQLREQAKARASAARSANLTNLFDNLGAVGNDEMQKDWMKMLAFSGYFGTLSSKPNWMSKKDWKSYQELLKKKASEKKASDKENG